MSVLYLSPLIAKSLEEPACADWDLVYFASVIVCSLGSYPSYSPESLGRRLRGEKSRAVAPLLLYSLFF